SRLGLVGWRQHCADSNISIDRLIGWSHDGNLCRPMSSSGLLASYWTVAGPVRPLDGSEISPWDIRDRIRVAAETGFTGVGFSHADLMAWSDRLGFGAIRHALEDHGIVHCEYESLFDWWADGDRRAASDRARADLLRAVEEIAAPHSHIKCGPDLLGEQ